MDLVAAAALHDANEDRELSQNEWQSLLDETYGPMVPLDMMVVRGSAVRARHDSFPAVIFLPYPRSRLSPLAEQHDAH